MKKIYTLEVPNGDFYNENIIHSQIPTLEIIESLCKYYIEEQGFSGTDLLITESYSYSDYKMSVINKSAKDSIRLLKAAKELDVETEYIVKTLEYLGEFIDHRPTAKLSLEQYEMLKEKHFKDTLLDNMQGRQ